MTTYNKITAFSYADRLNLVKRLRLLRNTTGELSAYTGIDLKNNNFSKKDPFVAKCIYSEFSRETAQRTGLELDDLLEKYQAASCYYNKIPKTRIAKLESSHRGVLQCLFDADFAASEEGQPFRSGAKAAGKIDAALLTLLILRILPSFESKDGEVDINSFYEHLAQLRDYFRPMYEDSRVMQFAPYLTELYQKAVRRIRNGELFTRLELIDFTQEIIANLKNNYNPENLLQANLYLNQYKIHPELEGKLWIEQDFHSPMPVYWSFESLGMDYIVSRKQYDMAKKHITETRYELNLHRDETTQTFTLMRQSAAENLCQGQPIPENAYMQGLCRLDNDDVPTIIQFIFTSNRYDDFPTILTIADEAADRVVVMADDTWTKECETGAWIYLSAERVITSRYIYVECDSEATPDGGHRVISWYRVPRNGLLTEVGINTTLARIRHDNRQYIGFVPQNCFYEVADDANRDSSGITIQNEITVEY